MPAAPDDWRRMGQERYLTGVALERRPYAPPDQTELRAWRSASRDVVVQGFTASPPIEGVLSPPGSLNDWEEIPPPHPWDHDHCEFCGAKFMGTDSPTSSDPDVLTEGYVSLDPGQGERWICDTCFDDFSDEFNWSVVGA